MPPGKRCCLAAVTYRRAPFPRSLGMEQPIIGAIELQPFERVGSRSAGGAGYGPGYGRDPALVLADVREGYITVERAASTEA